MIPSTGAERRRINPVFVPKGGFTRTVACGVPRVEMNVQPSRDWRIREGGAKGLIQKVRTLYTDEELDIEWDHGDLKISTSTPPCIVPDEPYR